MALPDGLRDAVMRLPAAAARLAGVPGSGLPLDAGEAEQLAGMLVAVNTALMDEDSSVVDAILSDDRLLLALLRVLTFAVRGSQLSEPAFCYVSEAAFQAGASLLGRHPPTAWRARAQLGFGRKLLRMDTLQCCSSMFATSTAALEALAAGRAAGAEAGPTEAGAAAAKAGRIPPIAVFQLLKSGLLVTNMLHLSAASVVAPRAPGATCSARQRQQLEEQQQLYARELAAALRDSRVLEHCVRWALHAQLAVSAGRVVAEVWRINILYGIIVQLRNCQFAIATGCDGATLSALREALSGPCVRHLVLSLGLATLCAADGGPSHGLPDELLFHLPVLGRASEDLRGMHGRQQLQSYGFDCMLWVLQDSTAASATPPRDWRSVVALLHRIGSLLLASARAWADEAAVAAAGPQPPAAQPPAAQPPAAQPPAAQPPALQLVLDTTVIAAMAVRVLKQFRRLVGEQQAASAGAPAALAEAEAAWWRLAVDVATHCVRWGSSSDRGELADLLSLVWGPLPADGALVAGRLPVAAPHVVAAALAGGLLPLWERLLRCAGREPRSPEASLLTCMLQKAGNPEGLCNLLACCEPRQGAALVATWGKLLRTLALPQLLSGVDEGADTPRSTLACALVTCAGAVLTATVGPLVSRGYQVPAAAAAEAAEPQLQLALLLSFALCEWLPPLARLAREGLLAMRMLVLKAAHSEAISVSSVAMMQWLPALATRGVGRAVEEAVGDAAAKAPAASPAADSWQQLLLREAGAVAVLGDVLRHTPVASGGADQLSSTAGLVPPVTASCCVAAACPGEARQAVLAAAAEAAPAASSGGGRGGVGGGRAGGGRQRGGRGFGGRGGGSGLSHAAAELLPGWSPQRLQMLADELRAGGAAGGAARGAALATAASALARQAGLWAAGGGEDSDELVRAVAAMLPGSMDDKLARALASSSSEPRALLRTCANPACDNLAGDSEAGLPLRACGRCGGAWYCRKECLAAHWRVGHREACTGRGPTAAVSFEIRNISARQRNGSEISVCLHPLVSPWTGAFPGPEVPFPLTCRELRELTAWQLAALEAFYDTQFGQPTNSLDYRRAVFAAYIGDTSSWVDLKRWALGEARRLQVDVTKEPHQLYAGTCSIGRAEMRTGRDGTLMPWLGLRTGQVSFEIRNSSARQRNGSDTSVCLQPLVSPWTGAFPGPEVPFPLTGWGLRELTAWQLEALEAFYDTKFGQPTNSLDYRRAVFAAYIGDTGNWVDLKERALAEARRRQVDVTKEPHRL
ncbi:hypothetical protein TSOC_012211 [Tetrabaena socialis]|uniref:phytol kinase n=1 Tax=Tetrabaena socialis TaxID=47790 RepID=A0A2J7ZNM6_9CHLO|nr:hypothetical protein TSOC_012211 [Tetrabaena socialis]|eukprot:PNH01865.1 hypothetical protein TSOC_012211 [Tetrabaena socialis]